MSKKDRNRNRKIMLVRYGGANTVYQKKGITPENKGIWVFVQDLWDPFYLSGTDKLINNNIAKKRIILSLCFEFVFSV